MTDSIHSPEEVTTCTWQKTGDYGQYGTQCGKDFWFEDGESLCVEFTWCPYCGKVITEGEDEVAASL